MGKRKEKKGWPGEDGESTAFRGEMVGRGRDGREGGMYVGRVRAACMHAYLLR